MPEALKQFLSVFESKLTDYPSFKMSFSKIDEAIKNAQWLAGEKWEVVVNIVTEINLLCDSLNMNFLFNSSRKLFSIGYHVDDRCLDNSYYDLLASEARIASFVAIAKNDVPLEHWWALGRPFGYLYGRHVLMSWGGTMFEYLMPILFKKTYSDSLMDVACKHAVECQIIYAKHRGIPWGISESAFSAIDFIRSTNIAASVYQV